MKSNSSPLPLRPHARLSTRVQTLLLGTAALMGVSVDASTSPGALPRVRTEVNAVYSYSSHGDLKRAGKIGEVEVQRYRFTYNVMAPLREDLRGMAGLLWSYDELNFKGDVPLPESLYAVSIPVGLTKDLSAEFGPGWSATVMLMPGFFADHSNWTRSAFNAPGLVTFAYQASADLTWNLGLGVNLKSRYEVLPALGVRWAFAPDWLLTVGLPQSEVSYHATPNLTLKAGARFQGGNYRVTTSPAAGLENANLDYREIRLGGGIDYRMWRVLTLSIDAGVVADRRFNYPDRNYRLNGSSAVYVSVGAEARF